MLSSSVDKSQWLKEKHESIQSVYTDIYNHGILLMTLMKLGSESPVTLHWGLMKLVFKEFMQEKKI